MLILAHTVSAQVPDYLDNDPKWRQEWLFGGYMPCLEIHNYIYYLNGDSTVGNFVYKKVFKRLEIDYNWMAPPPPIMCEGSSYYDVFCALIRQESLKLYLNDNDNDYLLYDFDLTVGDTLPITWNMWIEGIVVTSIDSILIGDIYRKIFNLNDVSSIPDFLIEGIGFSGGFIDYYPSPEFPSVLLCFTLNDTTYYPSYGYSCDLSVSIPSVIADEEFKMFPNPIIDKLTIETNSQAIFDQVIAYDIAGNKIQLKFKLKHPDKIIIDCSSIRPGFYILQLQSGKTIPINLKVIKQ